MKNARFVLTFNADIVEEPIIYRLITEFGIKVNILRASIDPGKQGTMVVELEAERQQLAQGLEFFETSGVRVETLAQEIHHLTDLCTSCTACVPICPTDAIDVDRESWQVAYDTEKCVVCLSCIDACPYRAVEISVQ